MICERLENVEIVVIELGNVEPIVLFAADICALIGRSMITIEIWVFAGCFGLLGVLWGYSMRNISLQIAQVSQEAPDWSGIIDEVKGLIPAASSAGPLDLGEMIQDAIEDAMGSVQMPTAFDHIAGFATMFLQQKMKMSNTIKY